MPAVSVVMPVYNAMPYLPLAIESILTQSFDDFELIVLDDASTDEGHAFLASVRDPRLLVIRCGKQGLGALLNEGLRIARGRYVACMHGDDISLTDRFLHQWHYLEHNTDVGVVGCQYDIINQQGAITQHIALPTSDAQIKFHLLARCPFAHPGVMYRRDLVLSVGGYQAELVPTEDYDLWWRLADCCRFANLPETLLRYRRHLTNLSITQHARQSDLTAYLAVHYMRRLGFAATELEAQQFLQVFFRILATSHFSPSPSQTRVLFSVIERFIDWIVTSAPLTGLEGAKLVRADLRWLLMSQAVGNLLALPDFLSWLRLAARVDPDQMRPWPLTKRVFGISRRVIKRLLGR